LLAAAHRAARQRRLPAQLVDHRAAQPRREILFERDLAAILEPVDRLDQRDEPDLDEILDLAHARNAAMDVPCDAANQRCVLAHQRIHVCRCRATVRQRLGVGERLFHRERAHAASA
jgi:hypothetical protein